MNCDPSHLAVYQLALACVQSHPHVEAEFGHQFGNGAAAADRSGRPVEGGEETVSGRIHLVAAEAHELAAHQLVVLLEQRAPCAVAQRRRFLAGADDVREEDGGEDSVRFDLGVLPRGDVGEEAFELREKPLLVATGRGEVRTRQLHEARARNVIGQVAPATDVPSSSLLPMHDQSGDANRRE